MRGNDIRRVTAKIAYPALHLLIPRVVIHVVECAGRGDKLLGRFFTGFDK